VTPNLVVALIAQQFDERTADLGLGGRMMYRPDLEGKGPEALARALVSVNPDILIARRHPEASVAAAWRDSMPERHLVAIATGAKGEQDPALVRLGIAAQWASDGEVEAHELTTLALAERTWAHACTRAELSRMADCARSSRGRSVAIVGAGIVNLLTALLLAREGFAVDIYDACPDPREDCAAATYGCTRGGANARMFTLTEADAYHDKKRGLPGETYTPFDRSISDGGWRICDASLSVDDLKWSGEHRDVPSWLAHTYTEDILGFNREAGERWSRLMKVEEALFDDVELREGILRLYSQPERFKAQIARQDRLGATTRVLSTAELEESYPTLREACATNLIAGGIEVVGFTLGVHDFVDRILTQLESANATFHWRERIDGIQWGASLTVKGLHAGERSVRADHYVLSPGAHSGDLLRGSLSEGIIQGVLGVWLALPNIAPGLDRSLKIARTGHIAEDSNVTIGRDREGRPILIVGSGYGWTGLDPANVDAVEIQRMVEAVDDTARQFFPHAFEIARQGGMLESSRRLCVRPWTASNLGLFEIAEASGGGVLICTGGHNTGGFAQAPEVAAAVLAALRGESHPMHVLYHPQRLRRILGRDEDRRATAGQTPAL
jgi:glycine/D-amino acid oxidase-like deaminating enzyme